MPRNKEHKRAQQEYFFKAPANPTQQELIDSILSNDITLAQGPAGCGKTMISLQVGLQLLRQRQIDQIYYVRNPIDYRKFGSNGVGYLKGDYEDKTSFLLNPIKDNIYELVEFNKANYLIKDEKIYPLILDYIQGMSWVNKYVIIDESQNIPSAAMEMLLTRISRNTKIVIIGDPKQKATKMNLTNGIQDAYHRLNHIKGIGTVRFHQNHAQTRHELIPEILQAYSDIANDLN